MTKIKLTDLIPNPDNPRTITDKDFDKLCNSIKEFPKMMEKRPMAIDSHGRVLGGNMRLRALEKLGYTEIPSNWTIDVSDLTEEEKQRFLVVDNLSFGEWDQDMLANTFDNKKLIDWGFKKFDLVGSYDAESKNKEVDVDSLEDKTEITLKFTSDEYLEVIELFNTLKEEGETYEGFLMRLLKNHKIY